MDVGLETLIAVVIIGLTGGFIALIRLVMENAMSIKQFGVGLGIALLLPLSVYYAAELIQPTPKEQVLQAQLQQLEGRPMAAPTVAEKEKVALQKATLKQQHADREKRHDQTLFSLGYLVGMAAIMAGIVTSVGGVSPGLLFGGLLTLGHACFSYWDTMADWLRFASLLAALIILGVLGGWRFRKEEAEAARRRDFPGSETPG